MDRSERALRRIGAKMAELVESAPETDLDLERGRARFLAERAPLPRVPVPRSRARLVVLLVAAALALGAVLVSARRPRTPLAFEAHGAPGIAGAWIAASEAPAPIRFSDGSRLQLASGGRARVAALDADGAEIALERGTLELAVVHRADTHWRVDVGPFVVKVVGTRFQTSWDPERERFSLALEEGAVRISGPVIGEDHLVRAGERVTVDGSLVVEPIVRAETQRPAEAPAARNDEAPASASSAQPAPTALPKVAASADAASSWRTLAGAARYPEALAAAEASGYEALLGSGNAADLRALADVARLAGSPRRAEQAATALLDRFPRSSEAADVAFMLGRAAQDQRHDGATARRWFERYLAEHPGGRFADEASGRLIELADREGNAEAAKAAAERYLARHPGGAHAAYAERIVGRAPR